MRLAVESYSYRLVLGLFAWQLAFGHATLCIDFVYSSSTALPIDPDNAFVSIDARSSTLSTIIIFAYFGGGYLIEIFEMEHS